ncbi:IS4 family transposase [Halochromatium sp.]
MGRRFGGGSELRHRIKRADRLLGNRHLQRDSHGIYTALSRVLLAGVAEPLIVIDWSDLKEDQSLHLLRASVPVGGRSLTLYEEVHTQRRLGNRQVQHRFLRRLAAMIPATAAPILVADSDFKVPFYREVERLGWRWVGRVRGRDFVKLKIRWRSCKQVFKEAATTPKALGIGAWVRSNPLQVTFVLVRQPRRGRQAKTASGNRSRSKKGQQAARAAREPWLLVASTRLAQWSAKRLVKVYRQRSKLG